jgi:hypothetical protein
MQTIIKIQPAEFTGLLLEKIQKMLVGNKDAEITISIQDKPQKKYLRNETRDEYFAHLNESIDQLKRGNVITFTAESFEEFARITLS